MARTLCQIWRTPHPPHLSCVRRGSLDLFWFHMVKYSSGVRKFLLSIFYRECVLGVLNYLDFVAICEVACIKLTHSSSVDREDIVITHLIIIIKWTVSIFPIVVIFSRVCVHQMFVTSYAVVFIYTPEKEAFLIIITVQSYDIRKWLKHIMARWSYSFVCTLHYIIIIIMQTYLKVLHFENFCQSYSADCE